MFWSLELKSAKRMSHQFYGFQLLNEDTFGKEFREAARAEGFGKSIVVSYVVPGSKAEQANLLTGDVVKRLGRWNASTPGKEPLKGILKLLSENENVSNMLAMTVVRNNEDVEINIDKEIACKYPVLLGENDEVNAYADGNNIIVEKGMLRFAAQDEELALVISHELAHNAMGHISAKKANVIVGGVAGFLVDLALAAATGGLHSDATFTRAGMQAGAGSYSVEFEQEADYVSMYFLKRAGYEVAEAPNFWRLMGIEHPRSIELRKSHPTTPERYVALKSAIDEIEEKVTSGSALLPEMKQ